MLEAVDLGDRASVEHLLDEGANIEAMGGNKETPLMVAAEHGTAGMVKLLLERGANIHAQDESGETALAKAAHSPDVEITKMLLARTATLAEKNQALLMLVQGLPAVKSLDAPEDADKFEEINDEAHAEIAKLLLDAGADVEARDESGNTPLMNAASYGAVMVLKVLLARGADINATDADGGTALMDAACDCGVTDKPDTRAA